MNNKIYPIFIYLLCILIAGIAFAIKTEDLNYKIIVFMLVVAFVGAIPFQFFSNIANKEKRFRDGFDIGCAIFFLIIFVFVVIWFLIKA